LGRKGSSEKPLFIYHPRNKLQCCLLRRKKLLILLSKHEKIYYLFCFNKKKLVDVGKVDLESRKNLIRKFGVHKNKLISWVEVVVLDIQQVRSLLKLSETND